MANTFVFDEYKLGCAEKPTIVVIVAGQFQATRREGFVAFVPRKAPHLLLNLDQGAYTLEDVAGMLGKWLYGGWAWEGLATAVCGHYAVCK